MVRVTSRCHTARQARAWLHGLRFRLDGVVEVEEEEVEVVELYEAGDEEDPAEAALRQMEAEGLTLQPSDNATGYRGVSKDFRSKTKLFQATLGRAGQRVYLGSFVTAEEAALAIARADAGGGRGGSRARRGCRPQAGRCARERVCSRARACVCRGKTTKTYTL